MDAVYVVRDGDNNEELRWSLRSLVANVPHDRVWIVGNHPPSWLTNVGRIESPQHWSKYVNSTRSVLAACDHPEVSDRFIYSNDDFFVLRPIDEVPTLHRGPVSEVVGDYEQRHGPLKMSDHYRHGMAATARILNLWGHPEPLSYEMHVPMVVEGEVMADAIRRAIATDRSIVALHKRSLYGNVAGVGGEYWKDHKVLGLKRTWPEGQTFTSTEDEAFRNGEIGRRLREMFPNPSPYER